MAEGVESPSRSATITTTQEPSLEPVQMVLHLRKPKSSKKVQWQEEVVDNELLGRKRSKCCCIYTKPHKTDGDDSSSDDDSDWDDNCCHEHKVGRSYVPHNKGNTTPTDN